MRSRSIVVCGAVVASILLVGGVATAAGGRWVPAGKMHTARVFSVESVLHDGRMLVAGGADGSRVFRSAELYDPRSGTHGSWTITGSMARPRLTSQAVTLEDGRVLVPGGQGPCCRVYASAELFDPSTGTWSSAGNMTTPRTFATVTLLDDGRVLVAGGAKTAHPGHPDKVLASAEIYDPVAGTWTATGSMKTAREWAGATLLGDGRVLVAGGYDERFHAYPSAEVYDPLKGTWSSVGHMAHGRAQQGATLLDDGRVLEVGGRGSGSPLDSAELYDPVSGSWSSAGAMIDARQSPIVAMLKDGTVLVAGGFGDGIDALVSAELYTPSDGGIGTWSPLPDMPGPRADGVGLRIRGGRVLVAGGFDRGDGHDAPRDAFAYVPS